MKTKKLSLVCFLLIFLAACQAPTVVITSPESGQQIPLGANANFIVKADDFLGKAIDEANIFWTSSLDGQIGTGASFSRSDLSEGIHVITCFATDKFGKQGSASISITVGEEITTTTTTTISSTTTTASNIPTIIIDGISPYGETNGYVWGHIEGVTVADLHKFGVSCIIKVEGWWWSKPYMNELISSIKSDGTFKIDINTGGVDPCATAAKVCLVPIDSQNVTNCGPCYEPVEPSDALDCDIIDRSPLARIINFSGHDFEVKYGSCLIGPGPNYFSDDVKNVFVDDEGHLHLTIKQKNGEWFSTEVIGKNAFGYGIYTFVINSRVDLFDINTVLGLFTWDQAAHSISYREIDMEFAKWGIIDILTNSQFVLQPCSACPGGGANCSRYSVELTDTDKHLTCQLIWTQGEAHLRTYYGNYPEGDPPDSALVYEHVFSGAGVPEPGEAVVRMNLWLYHGYPPENGLDEEVVIDSFSWRAIETTTTTTIQLTTTTTSSIPSTSTTSSIATTSSTSSSVATTTSSVITTSSTSSSSSTTTSIAVPPSIKITDAGHIGDMSAKAVGLTTGVSPDSYGVAVYILVRGAWWTKPLFYLPITLIDLAGNWQCSITTGGVDEEATKVRAYLWPTYAGNPPMANGIAEIPMEPGIIFDEITRTAQ